MKEDLAIARNSLLALQAENLALRRNAQAGNNEVRNDNSNNILDHIDPEMAQALSAEKKKRMDAERELELQVWNNTSVLTLGAPTIIYNFFFSRLRFR